jgi:KUP system potassium uptake protein
MSAGEQRGASPVLIIGALGIVFGDIGTSPLYAMRTVLGEGGPLTTETVYGLTSTVIWTMVVIVSVLFVGLLLRADNEGEGGALALLALVRRTSAGARTAMIATVLGIVAAAMFLGDCVITPAISVLSAAEGLEVASPSLKAFVLPVALVLLAGVFVVQRIGSGFIGRFSGPVMVLWFATLAVGGAASLAQRPEVLQALSPHWAVRYFLDDPEVAFLALGAVILSVTGAEALYTDLGHFGRPAITRAWTLAVFPALVLAYLGEASAVVRDHAAAGNPFYAVMPGWATIPVLVLATMATVIASEAVIAGAFTVLHQAAGLGLFPYLRTRHTSRTQAGQIYLPAANWALAAGVLLVVLVFRESSRLSSAYGVAVSTTFLVTVLLYLLVQHTRGTRTVGREIIAGLSLVAVIAFFVATLPKVATGGWVPVSIGVAVLIVMWTWWSGQRRLAAARGSIELSPEDMLGEIVTSTDPEHRTPGSAVFLTRDSHVAPLALCAVVESGYTLAERVVLLSWHVADTPSAPANDAAVTVDTFGDRYAGILAVTVTLGYRERLDVIHVLEEACAAEPDALSGVDPKTARFFLSEPIPQLNSDNGMAMWRQRLFLLIDRLSTDRIEHLDLPHDRTIVIGRDFEL